MLSYRKKVPCSKCDNVYTSKSLLDAHFVIHTGEKQFACTVCNKSFAFKAVLTTHMRSHTDVRPFKCKICIEAFRLVVKIFDLLLFISSFSRDIFWQRSFKFMRSSRRIIFCDIYALFIMEVALWRVNWLDLLYDFDSLELDKWESICKTFAVAVNEKVVKFVAILVYHLSCFIVFISIYSYNTRRVHQNL